MSEFYFTAKCENCGEEYDNYMRTLFIEEKEKRTCVCLDCRNKLSKGKIYYTNHIPAFCDGGNLVTRIFDSVDELKQFVLNQADEKEIVTFDDYTIVEVRKNEKYWWVRGFVSHNLDLPDFHKTLVDLGYNK